MIHARRVHAGQRTKTPWVAAVPLLDASLAGTLPQRGKLHFGYIYGISIIGCTLMWILLNLMCPRGIDVYRTVSVLGYCLLPMVIFSGCAVLLSMQGIIGIFLGLPTPPLLWLCSRCISCHVDV